MGLSVDFKPNIAIDKIVALALALCLVVPFTEMVSQKILIVTSYGHFALAHLYQWKRKTPSKTYFLFFFMALAGFWAFSFHVAIWPTVMVLTCFFFHCLWDEFKLTGEDTNVLSGFLVITMVSTQVMWLLESFGLRIDFYIQCWLLLTGAAFLLLCLGLYIKDRLHLSTTIILFALTQAAFMAFYFAGVAMTAILIFRVLIHFHGISWYIEVGRKYWRTDRTKFRIYLNDVAIINTVFIGGYCAYVLWPETLAFLGYGFYSIAAYYAWSMMHLITTFRQDDYKNMIRWPVMARR